MSNRYIVELITSWGRRLALGWRGGAASEDKLREIIGRLARVEGDCPCACRGGGAPSMPSYASIVASNVCCRSVELDLQGAELRASASAIAVESRCAARCRVESSVVDPNLASTLLFNSLVSGVDVNMLVSAMPCSCAVAGCAGCIGMVGLSYNHPPLVVELAYGDPLALVPAAYIGLERGCGESSGCANMMDTMLVPHRAVIDYLEAPGVPQLSARYEYARGSVSFRVGVPSQALPSQYAGIVSDTMMIRMLNVGYGVKVVSGFESPELDVEGDIVSVTSSSMEEFAGARCLRWATVSRGFSGVGAYAACAAYAGAVAAALDSATGGYNRAARGGFAAAVASLLGCSAGFDADAAEWASSVVSGEPSWLVEAARAVHGVVGSHYADIEDLGWRALAAMVLGAAYGYAAAAGAGDPRGVALEAARSAMAALESAGSRDDLLMLVDGEPVACSYAAVRVFDAGGVAMIEGVVDYSEGVDYHCTLISAAIAEARRLVKPSLVSAAVVAEGTVAEAVMARVTGGAAYASVSAAVDCRGSARVSLSRGGGVVSAPLSCSDLPRTTVGVRVAYLMGMAMPSACYASGAPGYGGSVNASLRCLVA